MTVHYRDLEDGELYELVVIERACGVPYAELEAVEPGPGQPTAKRMRIDEQTGAIDGHERTEI